jgi:hypothetical protein
MTCAAPGDSGSMTAVAKGVALRWQLAVICLVMIKLGWFRL